MTFNRRAVIAASLGAGATLTAATAVLAGSRAAPTKHKILKVTPTELSLDTDADQTAMLQDAIDRSSIAGEPLRLPPGRIKTGMLQLRPGTRILGASGATVLEFTGGAAFITGNNAHNVRLEDLVFDGANLELDARQTEALIHLAESSAVVLRGLIVQRSTLSGIALHRCSGSVSDCTFTHAELAGIRSLDASGLDIHHNTLSDCGNNGIQIWRSAQGEDASMVTANRIERVAAKAGGTGEYGNGVNVFRAGGVLVSMNRISDCAYSAVRANAASNVQMIANNCARIGEVALYAEFGFEGCVISSNIVDTAASGIAVTNFNEQGRLAVVQGNLLRNMYRRDSEPVDKRGIGISIEADSLVNANTIEKAESCGIMIGWGPYMRDCMVTGNLIRDSEQGILISDDETAGSAHLSANMISGATAGAIRMMNHGAPVGEDLGQRPDQKGRITIFANTLSAPMPRPLTRG